MDHTAGVILITGASSGLGKITAQGFLNRKWTVYAAARRTDLMSDLSSQGARVLRMDVTDAESVHAGVAQVIAESGRIDVLFANAGYGSYGAIETIPMDQVEQQFDVNVFGVGRTVQAVLPHMRSQRSGRVIITSSVAAHISTSGIGYYASSKHAVRGLGVALRQEVRRLGIHVSMVEPGVIRTGFESVANSALDALEPEEDYRETHRDIHAYVTRGFQRAPGPERTFRAVWHAATARRPRLVYRTTADARVLPVAKSLLTARLADSVSLFLQRRAVRKLARSG
jgi:NAD(P)-dependent dehydrogenase (short-subunit alcohol dehydrogenase family)